jgi:thermitase
MITKASLQTIATAVALLLALGMLMLPGASDDARALETESFVPGQIIVQIDPRIIDIGTVNFLFGTQVQERFLNSKSTNIYLLKITDGDGVLDKVAEISGVAGIKLAEPNLLVGAPEGDDGVKANPKHYAFPTGDATPTTKTYSRNSPSTGTTYDDAALKLSAARTISKGAGTTVAVIDTGAQMDHPALKSRFVGVPRYDFVSDDGDPSEPRLANSDTQRKQEVVGHGTHVAGIVNLVAPRAHLMPLRALDRKGGGSVFHVAEATAFADANGADVINLSLGAPRWSILLTRKINEAINHGSVVVAAAGNYDSVVSQYPASRTIPAADDDDGLLAVTSVDPEGKKSDFANYGRWVDVAAPGEEILSTYPVSRYAYWSGTSMATPFVAGEAALIKSQEAKSTPGGIEARIRFSARCLDDKNPDLPPGMLGAGHIDIGNSLRGIEGKHCTLTTVSGI